MKRTVTSLIVSACLATQAHAAVTDLLITEFTQRTSGTASYVEITNTHPSESFTFTDATQAVTLGSGRYTNVLTNADDSYLLTGTTLAPNQSVVLLNPNATTEQLELIEAAGGLALIGTGSGGFTNVYFNGDDSFALQHDGQTIDIVGLQTTGSNNSYWGTNTTIYRRLAEDGQIPSQSASFDERQWLHLSDVDHSDIGQGTFMAPAEPEVPFECNVTHLIGEVQGTGSVSPLVGQTVTVQGVITQVATLPSAGFYMQDLTPDNDPLTSDGIFVSTRNATTSMIGQTVCLSSAVAENWSQTQLSPSSWEITDATVRTVEAVDLIMIPEDEGLFANTLERHEGMLVRLPADIDPNTDGNQDMRVSKAFGFDFSVYRNTLSLAYERPNLQPNQLNVAGSPEAEAAIAENTDRRLVVESATSASNGHIPYYPDFNADQANNYIRIDDSIVGMEGVLAYSHSNFRLVPTQNITSDNLIRNLPRTDKPDLNTSAEGDKFAITVGTYNLYNFFNSPFGGDTNYQGSNRGAETYEEFERQKAKLIATIQAMDVDALGLMEVENNGFGDKGALAELVDELNLLANSNGSYVDSQKDHYAFIGFDANGDGSLDRFDNLGTDSISTGLIYRPNSLTLEATRIVTMPQQKAPAVVNDNGEIVKVASGSYAGTALEDGNNYHRDALVATFIVNQTGKRLSIAVNHFKSKGSTCNEDWHGVEFGDATTWSGSAPDLDQQGACEHFRVSGAYHLGQEMDKIAGDKIILGDLNAYAQEDPLLVLTENPRNKTLYGATYTYIGTQPQFSNYTQMPMISQTFGYMDALGTAAKQRGTTPWSYSYNDEVGSLDHILLSASMKDRFLDATDWHINAPESSLLDYTSGYKPSNYETDFYAANPFRSSDHDPAMVSLSYLPGEADAGQGVLLTRINSTIAVPYQIPSAIEVEEGDIAHISLRQKDSSLVLDLSQLTLSPLRLSAGQTLAMMDVMHAPSAEYTATMRIERNGQTLAGSTISQTIDVRSRDSGIPTIPTEKADNTGGATGWLALLGLLSLAGLRRRQQ